MKILLMYLYIVYYSQHLLNIIYLHLVSNTKTGKLTTCFVKAISVINGVRMATTFLT